MITADPRIEVDGRSLLRGDAGRLASEFSGRRRVEEVTRAGTDLRRGAFRFVVCGAVLTRTFVSWSMSRFSRSSTLPVLAGDGLGAGLADGAAAGKLSLPGTATGISPVPGDWPAAGCHAIPVPSHQKAISAIAVLLRDRIRSVSDLRR